MIYYFPPSAPCRVGGRGGMEVRLLQLYFNQSKSIYLMLAEGKYLVVHPTCSAHTIGPFFYPAPWTWLTHSPISVPMGFLSSDSLSNLPGRHMSSSTSVYLHLTTLDIVGGLFPLGLHYLLNPPPRLPDLYPNWYTQYQYMEAMSVVGAMVRWRRGGGFSK